MRVDSADVIDASVNLKSDCIVKIVWEIGQTHACKRLDRIPA